MSLPTTTIEIERNAAVVLQALLEKAKAQGTTLEAMLINRIFDCVADPLAIIDDW